MTPEQRTKAEKELGRYPTSLIETLGHDYKNHPRYGEAVNELVANPARGALAIISDIREAHAYHISAK